MSINGAIKRIMKVDIRKIKDKNLSELGIFIEFIPYLTAIENKLPHEKHNSKVTSIPFFVITFCLGQLPASFSGVYQENAFSKARVNVVYMMAYSSLAQFVCLILFAPVPCVVSTANTI